jgi:hypothetical protein
MQMFVSCPFCRRTFDVMSMASVRLVIDGNVRRAHVSCLPAQQYAVRSPGQPGNGPLQEESRK